MGSFLIVRKQFVSFSGVSSSLETITCGISKESTLRPLLFLNYVNDFYSIFTHSVIHHFADEKNILFNSKKLSTIEFN